MRIDDAGAVLPLGTYLEKGAAFPLDLEAFDYLVSLADRDLKYRGMRDDRPCVISLEASSDLVAVSARQSLPYDQSAQIS